MTALWFRLHSIKLSIPVETIFIIKLSARIAVWDAGKRGRGELWDFPYMKQVPNMLRILWRDVYLRFCRKHNARPLLCANRLTIVMYAELYDIQTAEICQYT